jgi:predicted nucleotide-binding protein
MAKTPVKAEKPRTALIIDRELFSAKLSEQILKGRKLEFTSFQKIEELEQREKEYALWNDYNEEFLKASFNNTANEHRSSYTGSGFMIGIHEIHNGASIYDPIFRAKTLMQEIEAKTSGLESILMKSDLIPSEIDQVPTTQSVGTKIQTVNPVVFIIHGHDEEMKRSVQLFLTRSELKDIVLHEQPDKNRTIIEKLIEESENAGYVIALLSPDDVQEDGTLRARQNVILEIGYFIGKLGRDKVRLLKRGDTEIPSDLQGILYDTYDPSGAWRVKLAKENSPQAAGNLSQRD